MRSDFHEMTARIEALLARKSEDADLCPQSFRWEAGADGTIHWVDGITRAALIGRTIAMAPGADSDGPDMRMASAFRQRAPFRDAPFSIEGDGAAAGRWRMAGVPFFEPRTGGFAGFRGSAHREHPEQAIAEPAAQVAAALDETEAQPDSVRQLVHELRTPLNAIVGFAEMIDGQHLGPAGAGYRARAAGIRQQAAQLLSAVDDLDLAAKAETSYIDTARETDVAALLDEIEDRLSRSAGHKGWALRIETSANLPPARVEREVAERLLTRLIGAAAAATESDEVLPGWLRHDDEREAIVFCIHRPRRLGAFSDKELVDPMLDLAGAGTGGAPLGFGFTLRLVRRIAESLGGSLDIHSDHLFLLLPVAGTEGRIAAE